MPGRLCAELIRWAFIFTATHAVGRPFTVDSLNVM